MVLLIAGEGPLALAVQNALEQTGVQVGRAPPDDDDLFMKALGGQAVIYAPSASLLAGALAPQPDPERATRVLKACTAPGVRLVVFILPQHAAYDAELERLRSDGTAYIVLRAPPLLEELAASIAQDSFRRLWLPRSGQRMAASGAAVAAAVVDALGSDRQGNVIDLPGEALDAATLFQRAAERGARQVRVHAVREPIFRLVRPVARLLRGKEPAAFALWERLQKV